MAPTFRCRRRFLWERPQYSSDPPPSPTTTMPRPADSADRNSWGQPVKPPSQFIAELQAESKDTSSSSANPERTEDEDLIDEKWCDAMFPMSIPQAEQVRQAMSLPMRNPGGAMPEPEATSSNSPTLIKAESSTDPAGEMEEMAVPERPERRPQPDVIGHPPTQNDFLEYYPPGTASILFYSDESQRPVAIHNLDVGRIGDRCPLLAAAFEESRGRPQLYLEMLSWETAWPFLRFLYTGTYALVEPYGDFYADVPTSVLLHCQLYQLGDIYDLPELKTQAYVNVLRQCEFGCSSPHKPIDICVAIAFAYKSLRKHEGLIDAIINYCVSCFDTHNLGNDTDFKELAYALRPFHQDLCKNSMARGYENETASAIIQMPFEPYKPDTYASRDDFETFKCPKDVVYHFHSYDVNDEDSPKKRKRAVEGNRLVDFAGELAEYHEHGDLAFRPLPLEDVIKSEASEDKLLEWGPERFHHARRRKVSVGDEGPVFASPASASGSDYDVLTGPKPVEEVSPDGESDCSTLVEVKREDVPEDTNAQGLPIRLRTADTAVEVPETSQIDSDCESEWTLV